MTIVIKDDEDYNLFMEHFGEDKYISGIDMKDTVMLLPAELYKNNDKLEFGYIDGEEIISVTDYIKQQKENNMKIKYDLQVFHNVVLFKVLEVDEKYRSEGKNNSLFESSNGLKVNSHNCPELYNNEIYIFGQNKQKDMRVGIFSFKTNQEAQEYADKVRFALEEWNNHVEIMEIEYKNGNYGNGEYRIEIGEEEHYKYIYINNSEDYMVMSYYIDDTLQQGFQLDKTIIMFNRDCELLNIPFRLK